MTNMCDSCLQNIVSRFTKDDLKFLNVLEAKPAVNSVMSMDKKEILAEAEGLTDFKFQTSSAKLELAGLIVKTHNKKSTRFYITQSGIRSLRIFKEMSIKNMGKIKKK